MNNIKQWLLGIWVIIMTLGTLPTFAGNVDSEGESLALVSFIFSSVVFGIWLGIPLLRQEWKKAKLNKEELYIVGQGKIMDQVEAMKFAKELESKNPKNEKAMVIRMENGSFLVVSYPVVKT